MKQRGRRGFGHLYRRGSVWWSYMTGEVSPDLLSLRQDLIRELYT